MKYIRGYSTLATSLTALTKKHVFQWTPSTQMSFETLKQVMTSPPVLALSNFNETFIIECDASAIRIRAVLMQKGHPLPILARNKKS